MNWKDKGKAWLPVLNECEQNLGIPRDLLARQCKQESGFDPKALNKVSGAVGIMQLLPKYFPGAGLNAAEDIKTAGHYLAALHKTFGDWQLALAAYDWGPENLRKWEHAGSQWPLMPNETRKYVTDIITDVPVGGSLCKIPSQIIPQGDPGSLAEKPSEEPLSGNSWGNSLSSRLMSIFRKNPAPSSPSPLPGLSKPSVLTSSQPKEPEMSTPNPILVAAAPTLITALQEVKTCINTILTGDPAQIPLRAGPATAILVSQLELLLPGLAVAETGVVNTDINAKLDGLITKLQALKPA